MLAARQPLSSHASSDVHATCGFRGASVRWLRAKLQSPEPEGHQELYYPVCFHVCSHCSDTREAFLQSDVLHNRDAAIDMTGSN